MSQEDFVRFHGVEVAQLIFQIDQMPSEVSSFIGDTFNEIKSFL
jgi:hypothetical protein